MDIGKVLRHLMAKEERSLRRTASDLKVDRPNLYRSLSRGNPRWKTVEMMLNYLGYEIQFVKSKGKEVKPETSKPSRSRQKREEK